MKKISQPFLVLAGSAIIAAVIIITFIIFSSTESLLQKEKIMLYDPSFNQKQGFAKISEIPPNSAWFFAYPSSVKFDVRENTFQTFLLIRLPEWLGGNKNDTSAFRAYSAVDLSSHCIVKYWPQEGRQRIEDPCISPFYRAIDGVLTYPGMKMLRAPSTGALPKLDLLIDKDGYIYVISPTFTEDKNGAIGVGRNISKKEMLQSSEFLLESYKKFYNITLDIQVELPTGEILTEITPRYNGADISYANPDSSTAIAKLYLTFCDCNDPSDVLIEQHRNEKYKQLWEIQSKPVIVTGQALYTGEDYVASTFRFFNFNFVKDEYIVSFEINQDFESASKIVLENFFDGANPSDMHRIS